MEITWQETMKQKTNPILGIHKWGAVAYNAKFKDEMKVSS
jgi:hypothetical protein